MRTLALCFALAGCSILKTKSVESVGAEKCTTSVGAAAADTAIVVGMAAFATFAAFQWEEGDNIAIPAAIGGGAIFTISALVGYTRVTRCKRAKIKEGIAY